MRFSSNTGTSPQGVWLPRPKCPNCRKPVVTCYCALLRPFSSEPRFVILIHRDEARRGVATGRMAHLVLRNSLLVEGTDFSDNDQVNRILADSALYPVILYPSPQALNLSRMIPADRERAFPAGKQVVVFVIDGTWKTARRMRRLSRNLASLPIVSLTPSAPSAFRVRKQPREECLSTLEAIHQVIELWPGESAKREARPHDNLLEVFHAMVRTQVEFELKSGRRHRIRTA